MLTQENTFSLKNAGNEEGLEELFLKQGIFGASDQILIPENISFYFNVL